jgi:outer membrane receptor protein involved in Fe transport
VPAQSQTSSAHSARRAGCGQALRRATVVVCAVLAQVSPARTRAVETPLNGLPLAEALTRIAADGLPLVYSSNVVRPDMTVSVEPRPGPARAMLEELLAPHGLVVREMTSGRLVIVRAPARASPSSTGPAPSLARVATVHEPDELVVTGSRYEFERAADSGRFALAAQELERLPDLGDDPLRAVARLPGTATGGFTAKSNIRGGEVDETLVRFDGFRLYNPFHLKDFQSLFSTIDPALVHSIEVYTGGFPVAFGDRMSGVIDVEPLAPERSRFGSVSIGLFSAGAVVGGGSESGRAAWLLAARRGNLDLIVDAVSPERGSPRYVDLYGRLDWRPSDNLSLRASALRFADDLEISDADQEENASADYEDSYVWLAADWQPRDDLEGRIYLGHATLDSERVGTAEQDGIATGSLDDRRDSQLLLFETRWQWRVADALRFDLGGDLRYAEGKFRYADEAQFDLLFDVEGAPPDTERERSLSASPHGTHTGVYARAQYALTPSLTTDVGLRFDHDTLPSDDDEVWSPRLGLVWQPNAKLELRSSWGRFAQSQGIYELQIADGVQEYLPAQRAEHWMLGLVYRPGRPVELRVDAYQKRYRNLRPRYENLLNSFVILPELKPDRLRIEAPEAAAEGAEVSLHSRSESPFGWWGHYSWSRVADRIDGRDVPRSWDQRHALGGGVGWNGDRWELTAAVAWRSGWPTTPIELVATEPVAIAAAGGRNSERLGTYLTLDLRAARRFVFDRSLLTVYLEVTNATNRGNECCTEYEFNSEQGEPGLETEPTYYPPTIPNLGFVLEF